MNYRAGHPIIKARDKVVVVCCIADTLKQAIYINGEFRICSGSMFSQPTLNALGIKFTTRLTKRTDEVWPNDINDLDHVILGE